MFALEQLEFPKFKRILASYCHSALGKDLASELAPLGSVDEINKRAALISEMQEFLQRMDFSFFNLENIESLLFHFEHQTYDFDEFKKIVISIQISNSICSDIEKTSDFPLLKEILEKLTPFPDIEQRFHRIFDADGSVLDSASSTLRSIRAKKISLRRSIMKTLQDNLDQFAQQKYLQESIVTQRDGRFVIPIKEGSAAFVKGIVHGRSSSKASVYMEPENVVKLNNSMEMTNSEEKQELFRIMREFTIEILNYKKELYQNQNQMAFLDFHLAAARWANKVRAVIPTISNEIKINLRQARHPLLIETLGSLEKVVPFDIALGEDFKMLVISGPNTGGKTVTLKTIGLLCLIALSGLPIPADESSSIYPFEHIFADIGDQQSLENALSTFSSHIKSISQMTGFGTEKSLVLIDEIGAATDPEQGSALAQAILEDMTEKKMLGVITTHYIALKLFAENHPNCRNAAMHFDPQEHVPTYHFQLGLPGNSFAIEVASNLGFPQSLIQRAKILTGKQSIELTEILKKMNEEKIALSRQLYEYQLKTSLLNKKVSEYEDKIVKLEEEGSIIKKNSLKQARDFLIQMQNELNSELKEIKKRDKSKKEVEQTVQRVQQKYKEISSDLQDLKKERLESVESPQIGQKVWLAELETEGEIIEITNETVKLDLDGMFFSTSWDKIYQVDSKNQKKKKTFKTASSFQMPAKMELNIIGYRFEDALPLLEKFIDAASYHGLEKIRIVHGKGTGALRSKVRRYLKQRKYVKDFYTPPDEVGGDGVTIAVMSS
jgi:DNA mismatch repair protein MutS2